MASVISKFAIAEIARGNIDYLNDTIKAVMVDSTTTFTPAITEQNLSDIPSGDRIGDVATLGSKTISDTGILDAADPIFLNVTGSLTQDLVVFYKDSGVEATSTIIVSHDTSNLATDGNNVTYTLDANGVLALAG